MWQESYCVRTKDQLLIARCNRSAGHYKQPPFLSNAITTVRLHKYMYRRQAQVETNAGVHGDGWPCADTSALEAFVRSVEAQSSRVDLLRNESR